MLATVIVYLILVALVHYDTWQRYRGFELVTDPKDRAEARKQMGVFAPFVGPSDGLWRNARGHVMWSRR